MIKYEKGKYILYSKAGKKLFSSVSYQTVVEREKQIAYFKAKAKGEVK